MALNLSLLGQEWEAGTASWTSTDALLYALGVGAGRDNPADELAYTTENSIGVEQVVLPTFLVTRSGDGAQPALGDYGSDRVLHGAQSLVVHEPIPVAGTVDVRSRVEAFLDKGRDAVIEMASDLVDPGTGRIIATTGTTVFVRGEGGFGGPRGATSAVEVPDRRPDTLVTSATGVDQALLYRLSGDRNPLHSDPVFAQKAGFDQPILHGLCTYGITARLLVGAVFNGDVERFGTFKARFVSPVLPGETLTVAAWQVEDGVVFNVRVGDRLVLDRGVIKERAHA